MITAGTIMLAGKATYKVHSGLESTEVDADAVSVTTSDGAIFQLSFRRADGKVSLSVNGQIAIYPVSGNAVRVDVKR